MQPTPLPDALRYAKGQFRHTVCADCLAGLNPCVEGNNVVVGHWCRVTKKHYVVDMGSDENEARAAVARLNYLDAPNFPRVGFPDVYATVNQSALTYTTTIRVNNFFTSEDTFRVMANVPCELIVTTVLPLEFSFSNYGTLLSAISGLQQAFRDALICRVNHNGLYKHIYLPRFKQRATLHFGHKRTTLTMPIGEVTDGMRFVFNTADLSGLSYRNFAELFASTLPFRQLATVRGVLEAEARHLEVYT